MKLTPTSSNSGWNTSVQESSFFSDLVLHMFPLFLTTQTSVPLAGHTLNSTQHIFTQLYPLNMLTPIHFHSTEDTTMCHDGCQAAYPHCPVHPCFSPPLPHTHTHKQNTAPPPWTWQLSTSPIQHIPAIIPATTSRCVWSSFPTSPGHDTTCSPNPSVKEVQIFQVGFLNPTGPISNLNLSWICPWYSYPLR